MYFFRNFEAYNMYTSYISFVGLGERILSLTDSVFLTIKFLPVLPAHCPVAERGIHALSSLLSPRLIFFFL